MVSVLGVDVVLSVGKDDKDCFSMVSSLFPADDMPEIVIVSHNLVSDGQKLISSKLSSSGISYCKNLHKAQNLTLIKKCLIGSSR